MVSLINCGLKDFIERTNNKTVFCFGSGLNFENFYYRLEELKADDKIEYIIDNNEVLSGTFKKTNNNDIPIISFNNFLKIKPNNFAIVITSYWGLVDILDQLDAELSLDGAECYVYFFMCNRNIIDLKENTNVEFIKGSAIKIPKTIHYGWFGGKPIPPDLEECIDSWRRFCPGYEIVKWDESNYDVMKNEYCKRTYKEKQWTFLNDYARLDIIYNYGGIYLDTDIELIKSYDDLLYNDAFFGFNFESYIEYGTGFGAKRKHPLIKDIKGIFEFPNNIFESYKRVCSSYGIKLNGKYQNINGVAVYPVEVLCPVHPILPTECYNGNTHSIHHYSSTWTDKKIIGDRNDKKEKIRNILEKRCLR